MSALTDIVTLLLLELLFEAKNLDQERFKDILCSIRIAHFTVHQFLCLFK